MRRKKTSVTCRVPLSPNRRPEEGRPIGTLKKYPFEQTRLGFMIRYEMPIVYYLIRRLFPASDSEPSVEIIERLCRVSNDPSTQKPKFQRYLREYAKCGVCCKRAKLLTPERKNYYEMLRKHKMQKYVIKNRRYIRRKTQDVKFDLEDTRRLRTLLKC